MAINIEETYIHYLMYSYIFLNIETYVLLYLFKDCPCNPSFIYYCINFKFYSCSILNIFGHKSNLSKTKQINLPFAWLTYSIKMSCSHRIFTAKFVLQHIMRDFCTIGCNKHCTQVYRPVCGSNWKTYGNKCLFEIARCKNPRLRIKKRGRCGRSKYILNRTLN